MKITIEWSTDDVLSVREDLTDEQADEVLEDVKRGHDASIGVNWTVIEAVADFKFPRSGE